MTELREVPEAMNEKAEALIAEAKIFAASHVHPLHRDGGADEERAANLEACQNAIIAVLNASGLCWDHGLQALGAAVGSLIVSCDDPAPVLEIIVNQAFSTAAQFRMPRAEGNA